MKVTLAGSQVMIDFQHAHFPPTPMNGVQVKGSTTAIANLGTDPINGVDRMESAVSWCSSKDQFDKAKGRKVSLTRLLEKLAISKEQRKVVWDVYHQRG